MTTVPNVISLLAISMALMFGGSPVFAKSGGDTGQVKTSGTSATPVTHPAGGPVARRPKGCGHKTYGECAFPPSQGATSGGDPIHRGPGNPVLHPK